MPSEKPFEAAVDIRQEWPRDLAYRDKNGAVIAIQFCGSRPRRLIVSDGVFYSLESNGVWRSIEADALRSEIRSTDPTALLTPYQIGAAVLGVKDMVRVEARPFDWINPPTDAPRPKDLVLFNNGLLNIHTRDLLPLDGSFFATAVPDYGYDMLTKCPKWMAWLGARLDKAFHPTLQEMTGYFMATDTTAHRYFGAFGAPRSGKTTYQNVVTGLVGPAHVVSKQLSDFGELFGLETAIGKRLIKVPDLQDVPHGTRPQAVERILALVGGDDVDIARKNLKAISGRQQCRILMGGNRPPKWFDESGALAARLIAIRFDRSFIGEEDARVEDGLMTELPGIANWALAGLRRLLTNNYQFTISEQGKAEVAADRLSASPAKRFAEDCLEVTGKISDVVLQTTVYAAYKMWADAEGLPQRDRDTFMRDLRAALYYVNPTQVRLPRPSWFIGKEYRPRVLTGVRKVRGVALVEETADDHIMQKAEGSG